MCAGSSLQRKEVMPGAEENGGLQEEVQKAEWLQKEGGGMREAEARMMEGEEMQDSAARKDGAKGKPNVQD